VRGIAFAPDGEACVSAGTDCTVKLWKVPFAPFEAGDVCVDEAPVYEFQGKNAFRGLDHHWKRRVFATAGAGVDVWDHERSEPISHFSWGADAVLSVKFNPVRRVKGHILVMPREDTYCNGELLRTWCPFFSKVCFSAWGGSWCRGEHSCSRLAYARDGRYVGCPHGTAG